MKVFGKEVTPEQVEAIKSRMTGDFTLSNLYAAAERAGLTRSVYYRAVDRILQAERKARRIEYQGSGKWVKL